ncbi:YfcL family protein [Sodalis sp. C49]|uniref:YfcL family protein n=1 Tax=unclassified Sodalis (in: enterobacteria) TaxID=2636512 RepID=UPI003965926C
MIVTFETRILALIDDMVEHATDDELFAGGYLRGHLTLAVAEAEENNEHTLEALHDRVQACLAKAIGNGELSPPDQVLVLGMWHRLYEQAKAVPTINEI